MLEHWSSLTYMAEIAGTDKMPLALATDIVLFEMIPIGISRRVEGKPMAVSAASTYKPVFGVAVVRHLLIPILPVKVTFRTQDVTCRVRVVLLTC